MTDEQRDKFGMACMRACVFFTLLSLGAGFLAVAYSAKLAYGV